MKKSLYEQTMDSIKAPERVVDHMLSAVRDSEKKEKIIPMKNRKSNHIKRNVIAASLALALLFGAVFGISALSPKESPFIITVNAAEIFDSGYTPVGTLNGVGGDFHEENDEVTMTYSFAFNIRVEGEKVDDVLYTVKNGSIGAQGENKKSLNQSLWKRTKRCLPFWDFLPTPQIRPSPRKRGRRSAIGLTTREQSWKCLPCKRITTTANSVSQIAQAPSIPRFWSVFRSKRKSPIPTVQPRQKNLSLPATASPRTALRPSAQSWYNPYLSIWLPLRSLGGSFLHKSAYLSISLTCFLGCIPICIIIILAGT